MGCGTAGPSFFSIGFWVETETLAPGPEAVSGGRRSIGGIREGDRIFGVGTLGDIGIEVTLVSGAVNVFGFSGTAGNLGSKLGAAGSRIVDLGACTLIGGGGLVGVGTLRAGLFTSKVLVGFGLVWDMGTFGSIIIDGLGVTVGDMGGTLAMGFSVVDASRFISAAIAEKDGLNSGLLVPAAGTSIW